jgi:hypothetical protein
MIAFEWFLPTGGNAQPSSKRAGSCEALGEMSHVMQATSDDARITAGLIHKHHEAILRTSNR